MYEWPWPGWAAAGVFTLLEGRVARAVRVSRSSHVTEQSVNRLGQKHSSRLTTLCVIHPDKDDTSKRQNILYVFSIYTDRLCFLGLTGFSWPELGNKWSPRVCVFFLKVQENLQRKCWCFSSSDQTNTDFVLFQILPWSVLAVIKKQNN